MIIQHNIISEFGNRTLKSTNKRLGKSGEKLSGGYAINRAADNVAGLAISEKMRGQIRGLNRAKENIQEGIEYVKNADGAMNEITGMVQRMRELTVQALNDTNTKEDKEQIQLEITQLQNEIDRMVNHTEYNTKDIFDKHEPIYDSLLGNRNWDVDQVHEVYTPDNYLNIRLAPEYNPSEITVQVSEGNYTTYELLETIEDQLEGKAPDGTSLLIEYYKGGTCNLTFENGTEIENVDGGLAYLFYDCYGGAGIGDLIGTTEFAEQYPLSIVKGKNDELTFFIDKMDGSTPKKISIILDASKYTREEMIEAINTKLKNASHTEVSAIAYGDSNIKLSAGTSLITGLKGNMFQIDESKTAYDSVFYDNAKYGVVTSTAGKITGKAYYNSTCDKIVIDSTNNVLKIALQKDIVSGAGYTTITIPEKAEGYTIKELATVLNTQLVAISANDKWNFTTSNSYVSTSVLPSSGYYDCLQLTSLIEGNESKIVVDTGDAVSSAAYNALFKTTTLTSQKTPYIQTYGTDVYTKGYKTHNGEIDLQTAGKTLNISVNGGAAETITLSKAKYDSIDSLLDDIQKQIDASSRLAGKVVATKADGQNKIMLTSDNQDVTKINIITGTAYSELFTSKEPDYYSYTSSTAYGTTEKSQGSTVMVQTPATITLMYPMTTDNIVVDGTNNKLTLTVDGKNKTIILPNGTYTRAQLIQTLNLQFSQNGIGVTAKLNSQNKVQFTTNSAGDNASLFISTYSSNVATKVLMTPTIVTKTGSSSYKSPASIEGRKTITSNFTIDSSNKDFTFTYKEKSGSTWKDTLVDISLTEGAYTSPIDLVTALNKKIEEKLGSDKVVASLNSSKCIVIETVESGASYGLTVSNKNTSGGIVYGGGFYQNVLCDKTLQTKTNTPTNVSGGCMVGTSSLTDANINMAYVVGRADLKNETVEIKANVNDVLSLDFSYPKDTKTTETITLETKIPVGTHTGEEIVAILEEGLNKQLKEVYGITNFVIKPEIGNINTGVVGSNDNNALNFKLKWNKETTPVEGTYILDGVSGNAAYTVFYKTSGLPKPASITGTKDISGGVTITPETNTFGFTIDEKEYDFTLPEGEYTEEEFITMLNNLFASGDEDGDIPKLEAVLENGLLKLQYAIYGEHTIFDIRGTAKDILFFGKDGRDIAERMRLQIGANAGQELTLYKIPLSSALMKIDTLLVTNHSYAQYALKHLDYALNYINNQRSIYGAKNNRLEHAEQLATIEEEQMQTAESKIRDTDMADEIMRYSKEQILAQASQAMVAQSNSLYKDGVLKLLV